MRLIFLLSSLFILSACMNTAEVPSLAEEQSTTRILGNKTDAKDAQNAYVAIQKQREKE